MSIRVGQGYDIHALAPDRKLILAGVEIEHDTGLAGHSDADAVAHAIIDALFGAAALGDIGSHFPDTDPAFEGADSIALLRETVAKVAGAGWRVGNVDVSVIAQRPKLAPYIEAMRANLAAALGIDMGCVSVKAKTNEGLDAAGRGEAIAAHAVALIER